MVQLKGKYVMHQLRPHLEFFIEHRNDIGAVLEIDRQARKELPGRLAQLLCSAIEHNYNKQPWNGMPDAFFENSDEDDKIWWADKSFYDRNNNYGPYFLE